jgi:hypothetical protein
VGGGASPNAMGLGEVREWISVGEGDLAYMCGRTGCVHASGHVVDVFLLELSLA